MKQSRRNFVIGLALALSAPGFAQAAEPQNYDEKAFRAAQAAGKPVLVDIYASW
ncbi:MAG: hypothetical protein ACKVQK_05240 [Burkholderiales bacterium]